MSVKVLVVGILVALAQAAAARLLTKEAVYVLILSSPSALALEARGGCPDIDIVDWSDSMYSVQLRNTCPKGQTGLAGVFYVDRVTGRMWTDPDRRMPLESTRLTHLKALFFGRKPIFEETAAAMQK